MRINKLTASFGKLNNEALEFTDGLNVLCAPNESGKSTWCAFICAMLYGIDTAERAKVGYLPDKTRYAPWSGAPMQGTMELSCGLGDITITRTTRLKSAPMREFTAVYTGTNTAVAGLTGTNCGEMLTGVSKDVFCRSAFVGQGGVIVTGSSELANRITSIVSTGEETTSYSDADERLRAWLRRRRYNRRGLLPDLEARIEDGQYKLNGMAEAERKLAAMESECSAYEKECAELEERVNIARQGQRRKSLDLLNATRSELEACRTEYESANKAFEKLQDEISDNPFDGSDPDELRTQVRIDTDKAERLEELSQKVGPGMMIASVGSLAAAIVCAVLYLKSDAVLLIVCAVLAAVAGVMLMFKYIRALRDRDSAEKACSEILESYSVNSIGDIQEIFREYVSLRNALGEAKARKDKADEKLVKAQTVMNMLTEATLNELDFADGSSEAAQLSRELKRKKDERDRLANQISADRGKLSAVGDPMVLRSDIKEAKEELSVIEKEYNAINLAIDTLKAADTEIQSRFSPALGKLAAEYMGRMTGGRYTDIFVSRDFSTAVKTGDDSVNRQSSYLSAGTADQMYLAIRLAVCALAMDEKEICPLVIDDALVNFDEKRTAQAIELLKDISEGRQVILFTCK